MMMMMTSTRGPLDDSLHGRQIQLAWSERLIIALRESLYTKQFSQRIS